MILQWWVGCGYGCAGDGGDDEVVGVPVYKWWEYDDTPPIVLMNTISDVMNGRAIEGA